MLHKNVGIIDLPYTPLKGIGVRGPRPPISGIPGFSLIFNFFLLFCGPKWFHDVPGPPGTNSALVDGQNGGLASFPTFFGFRDFIFVFWDFGLLDFTSFYEPGGALRGQKILKNGTLFRDDGF